MAALRLPANFSYATANLILDEELRIYSVNTSAQELIGHTDSYLYRVKIQKVIANWPIESIHQEIPDFLEKVSIVARERIKLCNLSICKSPFFKEGQGGMLLISIFPLEEEGGGIPKDTSIQSPSAGLQEELRILEDDLGPLLEELRLQCEKAPMDPSLLRKIKSTYQGLRTLMRVDRGLPVISAEAAAVTFDKIQTSRGSTLVVDDNPVNRLILSKLLKIFGFDVEQAENGQEAVDKVKMTAFSCIFLDIQMPVLDGREACQQIRQLANGATIPIFMCSTEKDMQPHQMGPHGFTDRIDKPVKRQNLMETLDRFFPAAHSQPSQEGGGGGKAEDTEGAEIVNR